MSPINAGELFDGERPAIANIRTVAQVLANLDRIFSIGPEIDGRQLLLNGLNERIGGDGEQVPHTLLGILVMFILSPNIIVDIWEEPTLLL